ncbi:MAG TPA: hypothetical protein VKX17_12940 [Planctomycetota bacterium]|nr:hypothetical protein [Planctomycetota bacterium]
MNPIEFLQTAEELLVRNGREADLRSAVSRAYYCDYQELRLEVIKINARIRNTAGLGGTQQISHIKLCNALIGLGRFDPKIESIGRKLDSLRESRNKADYELQKSLSAAKAAEQLENAKEIRDQISSCGGAATLAKRLETYLNQLSPQTP